MTNNVKDSWRSWRLMPAWKRTTSRSAERSARSILRRWFEMSVHKALEELGFEFDNEMGDTEERIEIWVNKSTGMGVTIQWFHLEG
jgi:hypothetical protein